MRFSYSVGISGILLICAIISYSHAASDSLIHGGKEQFIDLGLFKFKAPSGEDPQLKPGVSRYCGMEKAQHMMENDHAKNHRP